MARTHIIQHWSDAAAYSGEMIGNRYSESKHFTKSGKANTDLYADVVPKKREPISVFDRICPQQKRLTVLEQQLKEIDKERYKVDELTFHEYRCVLLKKIVRQRILVDKAMGWTDDTSNEKASLYGKTSVQNDDSGVSNTDVSPSENIKNSAIKDLTNLVAGAIILLSGLGIIQQLFF